MRFGVDVEQNRINQFSKGRKRMTDQKLIAGIFNDFLGLYTGKIQTGIRPLIEKYKNHPMLISLI